MSLSYKDYYAVLGVARDATPEEIQRAYRALARKRHPDVDKGQGATQRFQELQEAYEVLGDPKRRARYDQLGERAEFEHAGDPTDFSDFFSAFFGARAASAEASHGDLDLSARLDIAPWEAALGAKVPFRHFDGSEVLLSIPAGSASGRELRLRGLGRPRRDGRRGDLYVELRIVVPTARDDAQRKLWQELARVSGFDPRA